MLLRVYVNAAATSLMRDKSSSYCIEAVLTQDHSVNTALSQGSSTLSSCCHLVQNLLVSRCWCVSPRNPEPGQEKLT